MTFEIKTADELADPELEARWAERREARQGALLRWILRAFVEHEGPVSVAEIQRAFTGWSPERVREEVARLDASDLLLLQDDEVRLAYPFSAEATPFVVRFKNGQERYACCAIDALGIAAMIGERVTIRSRCHHCGEPLEVSADARGPIGGDGVMVWVTRRRAEERRVSASL